MSAFSNGTEWDYWSNRWCMTCRHDGMGVRGNHPDGGRMCPIITTAICTPETPVEWVAGDTNGLADRYACTKYHPRDPEVDARAITGPDSMRQRPGPY